MFQLFCSCARTPKPTTTTIRQKSGASCSDQEPDCTAAHAGAAYVTGEKMIRMNDAATKSDSWVTPLDYELFAVIGRGCYDAATVLAARNVRWKKTVAVKRVNLENCQVEFQMLQNEVRMHRQLSHVNLLPSLDSFVHQNHLWLVLPLMGYGSCNDLIHAHFSSGLPEEAIAFILRDVILALEYLHSRNVIHRCVRASHLLVSAEGGVCLSGLRHCCSMLRHGQLTSSLFDFPSHFIHSLLWASPELLEQNLSGYSTKSDIYSVGITACELANGIAPFVGIPATQMLKEKLDGTMPRLMDTITIPELELADTEAQRITDVNNPDNICASRTFSLSFHNFVENCLQSDVKARPSASLLLQHAFFKGVRHKTCEGNLPALLRPVAPLTTVTDLPKVDGAIDSLTNDLDNFDMTSGWSF